MLSHGHLFYRRPSNSPFPYYLTNYTDSNFEWRGRMMWKILILEIFSKKTRKATTKNCPRLRCLCLNYSWEIHAISLTINSEEYHKFIITWNTRNTHVNPQSAMILNYMKQIEGKGRLTEGAILLYKHFCKI